MRLNNLYGLVLEILDKHLPGDHDQQDHNPHKIPQDILDKRLFHATDSANGLDILRDGFIRAGVSDSKAGGMLKPVQGKVYLTGKQDYPVIYALGGDMAGNDLPESFISKSQYGYIFEIDNNSLHDVQPDEDSIGEMVGKTLGGYGNKNAPQWLLSLAKNNLTPRQWQKVKDGEYSYWAQAGKKLVKKMSTEQKYELIRLGAHIANHGSVKIKRAFRLDKTRSKELKQDGSNLFDIAEEITLKHLIGQHDQGTHGGLHGTLMSIRENLVQKAQEVLDDWKPDSDGFDELFGTGGACDEIARAFSDVITEQLPDAEIFEGGQDGDDHAYILVKQGDKAYAVDIPPSVYETGGGYNWKKRDGVKLSQDDVSIYEVNASDLEEYDDHDYD